MTTSSADQAARPVSDTLPPIDCAPWCREGDGHVRAHFHADQWCTSEREEVVLTRRDLVRMRDGVWERDRLSIELQLDPGGDTVLVITDETIGGPGTELLPAEAQAFLGVLARFVDQAEQR